MFARPSNANLSILAAASLALSGTTYSQTAEAPPTIKSQPGSTLAIGSTLREDFFKKYGSIIPGMYSFDQFIPLDAAVTLEYLSRREALSLKEKMASASFGEIYEKKNELEVVIHVGQAGAIRRLETQVLLSGLMNRAEFNERLKALEKEDKLFAVHELYKIEILSNLLLSNPPGKDLLTFDWELADFPEHSSKSISNDPTIRAEGLLIKRAAQLSYHLSNLTNNQEIIPSFKEILTKSPKDELVDDLMELLHQLIALQEITHTLQDAKERKIITAQEFYTLLSESESEDREDRIQQIIEDLRLDIYFDEVVQDAKLAFPFIALQLEEIKTKDNPERVTKLRDLFKEIFSKDSQTKAPLSIENMDLPLPMLPRSAASK